MTLRRSMQPRSLVAPPALSIFVAAATLACTRPAPDPAPESEVTPVKLTLRAPASAERAEATDGPSASASAPLVDGPPPGPGALPPLPRIAAISGDRGSIISPDDTFVIELAAEGPLTALSETDLASRVRPLVSVRVTPPDGGSSLHVPAPDCVAPPLRADDVRSSDRTCQVPIGRRMGEPQAWPFELESVDCPGGSLPLCVGLTPLEPWPRGAAVAVEVAQPRPDHYPVRSDVMVRSRFEVESVHCGGGPCTSGARITIELSKPIDREALELEVSPSSASVSTPQSGATIEIEVDSDHPVGTPIEIVADAIESTDGERLEDLSWTIPIVDVPDITLERDLLIIDRRAPHRLVGSSGDHSGLELRAARVAPDELAPIASWLEGPRDTPPPIQASLERFTFETGHRSREFGIPLGELVPEREAGIVFFELTGPHTPPHHGLVAMTGLGATVHAGPKRIEALVSDLASTTPVSDAKVQVVDGEGEVHWQGAPNERGRVRAPGRGELDLSPDTPLWLVSRRAGDHSIVRIPATEAVPVPRLGGIAATDAWRYAPGDTIRILVWPRRIAPWPSEDISPATLAVALMTLDDVPLVERTVAVDEHGFAIASLRIPETSPGGRLTVRARDASERAEGALEQRIEVVAPRTARPGELDVGLRWARPASFEGPNNRLVLLGSVHDAEGVPVAGQEVALRVRAKAMGFPWPSYPQPWRPDAGGYVELHADIESTDENGGVRLELDGASLPPGPIVVEAELWLGGEQRGAPDAEAAHLVRAGCIATLDPEWVHTLPVRAGSVREIDIVVHREPGASCEGWSPPTTWKSEVKTSPPNAADVECEALDASRVGEIRDGTVVGRCELTVRAAANGEIRIAADDMPMVAMRISAEAAAPPRRKSETLDVSGPPTVGESLLASLIDAEASIGLVSWGAGIIHGSEVVERNAKRTRLSTALPVTLWDAPSMEIAATSLRPRTSFVLSSTGHDYDRGVAETDTSHVDVDAPAARLAMELEVEPAPEGDRNLVVSAIVRDGTGAVVPNAHVTLWTAGAGIGSSSLRARIRPERMFPEWSGPIELADTRDWQAERLGFTKPNVGWGRHRHPHLGRVGTRGRGGYGWPGASSTEPPARPPWVLESGVTDADGTIQFVISSAPSGLPFDVHVVASHGPRGLVQRTALLESPEAPIRALLHVRSMAVGDVLRGSLSLDDAGRVRDGDRVEVRSLSPGRLRIALPDGAPSPTPYSRVRVPIELEGISAGVAQVAVDVVNPDGDTRHAFRLPIAIRDDRVTVVEQAFIADDALVAMIESTRETGGSTGGGLPSDAGVAVDCDVDNDVGWWLDGDVVPDFCVAGSESLTSADAQILSARIDGTLRGRLALTGRPAPRWAHEFSWHVDGSDQAAIENDVLRLPRGERAVLTLSFQTTEAVRDAVIELTAPAGLSIVAAQSSDGLHPTKHKSLVETGARVDAEQLAVGRHAVSLEVVATRNGTFAVPPVRFRAREWGPSIVDSPWRVEVTDGASR